MTQCHRLSVVGLAETAYLPYLKQLRWKSKQRQSHLACTDKERDGLLKTKLRVR